MRTANAPTREVLAWLRQHREVRRTRARRIAYGVYVVVLLVAIYGWPVLHWIARSLGTRHLQAAAGDALIRALPTGFAALFVLTVVGAGRNALWRGPVVISEADVEWLLPTPLARGRILRPHAAAVLGGAVSVGAVAGALAAYLVDSVHPHVGARLVVGTIAFGAATATIAVGASTLVESSDRAARLLRRVWPAALALTVVLGACSATRAVGGSWGWAERVLLWSGPWGWAAQLASSNDPLSKRAIGIASVLLGLIAVAFVGAALRDVVHIRAASLRSRARLNRRVATDLRVGDARTARMQMRAACPAQLRTGARLRRSPQAGTRHCVARPHGAPARAGAGGMVGLLRGRVDADHRGRRGRVAATRPRARHRRARGSRGLRSRGRPPRGRADRQ